MRSSSRPEAAARTHRDIARLACAARVRRWCSARNSGTAPCGIDALGGSIGATDGMGPARSSFAERSGADAARLAAANPAGADRSRRRPRAGRGTSDGARLRALPALCRRRVPVAPSRASARRERGSTARSRRSPPVIREVIIRRSGRSCLCRRQCPILEDGRRLYSDEKPLHRTRRAASRASRSIAD